MPLCCTGPCALVLRCFRRMRTKCVRVCATTIILLPSVCECARIDRHQSLLFTRCSIDRIFIRPWIYYLPYKRTTSTSAGLLFFFPTPTTPLSFGTLSYFRDCRKKNLRFAQPRVTAISNTTTSISDRDHGTALNDHQRNARRSAPSCLIREKSSYRNSV